MRARPTVVPDNSIAKGSNRRPIAPIQTCYDAIAIHRLRAERRLNAHSLAAMHCEVHLGIGYLDMLLTRLAYE